MINNFMLLMLVSSVGTVQGIQAAAPLEKGASTSDVHDMAVTFAEAQSRHFLSLPSGQIEAMQAELRARMNLTDERIQHLLSDEQISNLLQEVKAFAESARNRFQMEASTGTTNETRMRHHKRILKSMMKDKVKLDMSSKMAKRANRYMSDSITKVVLAESVYYGVTYLIFASDRKSASKGALIIGLFWMMTIIMYIDAGFEPVEATYMTMQIPTTIGYGDMGLGFGGQENVKPLQVWSIMHMTASAFLVSQGVQTMFETQLMTRWNKMVCRAQCTNTQRRQAVVSSLFLYGATVGLGAYFYGKWEACTCSYGASAVEGCVENDCANTGGYIMDPIDALYMMVISAGSVGYGDYSPKSWLGRLVAIPFMMWALALHDYTATIIEQGMGKIWGGENQFDLLNVNGKKR